MFTYIVVLSIIKVLQKLSGYIEYIVTFGT